MSSTATTAATVLGRQAGLPSAAGPLGFIRRHPMATFLFLIFALTWLFQFPWIASTEGWLPFEFPFPLLFVMGWMPGLAAIIVTGATSGRAGIRTLLGRILIWRVGFKWYLFPILGSAALWTAALALDPLLGGAGLKLPPLSVELLLGATISLVLIFLVNSEEIAWRGFAMPRLQARHSALAASLFLGVFEGLFHLPYFIPLELRSSRGWISGLHDRSDSWCGYIHLAVQQHPRQRAAGHVVPYLHQHVDRGLPSAGR